MASSLASKIETLLAKTSEVEAGVRPRLTKLATQCNKLHAAAVRLADSWSGSHAGYHSELYYGNFEKPPLQDRFSPEWGAIFGIPDGWRPRQPEEVKQQVESTASAQFEPIEEQTTALVKEAKELQSEIVIELSPLHCSIGFDREKSLLEQLGEIHCKKKMGEYIHANMPNSFVTRDSEAMVQGIRVPAHLYYAGQAYVGTSRCTAVDEFFVSFRQACVSAD